MIEFVNDVESMTFLNQMRDGHVSWCEVQLRKPQTESQLYNMEKHSIYLTMWEGERTGLYLTPKQARKIAAWLICAAEMVDERNDEGD